MDSEQDQPHDPDPPILNYSAPAEADRWVTLRTFTSTVEASLACSKLEAEGIRATLSGQAAFNALGRYGAVSRGVTVMVFASDVAAATKIINEIEQRRLKRLNEAQGRLRCPRCGSADIRGYSIQYVRLAGVMGVIGIGLMIAGAAFIVGVMLAIGAIVLLIASPGRRSCRSCGRSWAFDPDDAPEVPDADDESEDQT